LRKRRSGISILAIGSLYSLIIILVLAQSACAAVNKTPAHTVTIPATQTESGAESTQNQAIEFEYSTPPTGTPCHHRHPKHFRIAPNAHNDYHTYTRPETTLAPTPVPQPVQS
jgi:hypothetical protein